MSSFAKTLSLAALLSLTQAHGVILNAQGLQGSPASVAFGVNPELARNCTAINPCQQDTTIIRDAEIAANVVNECGRTELTGNIDIGENTENAIAAGAVTQVKSGSQITVTIHQVNADGAGPYVCDLIEAGNNGVISQNLTVENNVPGVNGFSQAKTQEFEILVNMPKDFRCTGASSGKVCTVRCRNNAQAGPFGGCFPVEQVDVESNVNTPANIETALSLDGVFKQVANDVADLPAAVAAIQEAGSDQAKQNAAVASSLLKQTITTTEAPVLTPSVILGGNPTTAATATASSADTAQPTETGNAGGNGNGRGGNAGGNGNGNGRGGNGGGNGNGNGNGNGRGGNGGFGNGGGNGFGSGGGNFGNNNNNNKKRAEVFVA
ncbi:hypothetical protein DL771_007563 [Monosporascus sp. 5C6A]|nr:hypothetical protein DL771_007563 [Monosporascus sp. 5C6A]